MKVSWRAVASHLRHKLVLTSEEKRVILFVVAALALGGATKAYRERHPELARQLDSKHPWRKATAANVSPTPKAKRARKPRGNLSAPRSAPAPTDNEAER